MVNKYPFSQTEMKILIYNKVKRGMSYPDACKQLSSEIEQMYKTHAFAKKIPLEENGQVADLSCPSPRLRLQKGGKNGRHDNDRRTILPC